MLERKHATCEGHCRPGSAVRCPDSELLGIGRESVRRLVNSVNAALNFGAATWTAES